MLLTFSLFEWISCSSPICLREQKLVEAMPLRTYDHFRLTSVRYDDMPGP